MSRYGLGSLTERFGRRTIMIASGAAMVLVLAAVILAVSAFGPSADSGNEIAISSPAEQSAELFEKAINSIADGDNETAEELLREAIAVDPNNERARTELQRIITENDNSANNPSNPTGPSDAPDTPDPQDPADESEWDVEVAVDKLLPVLVDGYELGMAVVEGADAQVPGDPVGEGPVGTVRRALFSVHDRGTADAADTFIEAVTKTAFPQNQAEVDINGVAAYFGTDGDLFASVAFTRGRYVFEVIVTADEVAPGTLVDAAIAAASAFPTSP